MDRDELARVLRAFERAGLEYVLIGATARGFHGLIRVTEDVHLFIRATPENVARLRQALGEAYPGDPHIEEIQAEDLLGEYPAVRYYPPDDLFFDVMTRPGEAVSFETVEAEVKDFDAIRVPVATPAALYRLKRGTVRPGSRFARHMSFKPTASDRHAGRRAFLRGLAALPVAGAVAPLTRGHAQTSATTYLHQGRVDEAAHQVIDRGLAIDSIETFVQGAIGLVRVRTTDGREGWGQIAPYEPGVTVDILHRLIASHVLGKDPADIDAIVDRAVEANYKYPWSFVCRAVCGVDTAIWDLYGQVRGQSVAALLGGTRKEVPAYGSSMRRDISPADEGARLARLRDSHGFRAFKIRVGREVGRDSDAAPGRTEAIIPAVRRAVGPDVQLFADANSCYTPPKAIEVGRRLEEAGYTMYEEPCPYWELEWTAEVARTLTVPVSGGEQDNDLAQWRRMLAMNAVDITQPDICYVGGFTRAMRVARLAGKAGKPVIPHSANLSLVEVFSVHLMAAAPNAGNFLEFTIEWDAAVNTVSAAMYDPPLVVKDGRVRVPDGPGWGVRIKPAWLESSTRRVSTASPSR